METESFEIAPGVKNTDWIALNLKPESPASDWVIATKWFRKRVGRFLYPAKTLCRTEMYSGFAIMALDCLLIETLQSFRNGRENPVGRVKNDHSMLQFLKERDNFKDFFTDDQSRTNFIDHFRNGILHQGEVKSTGRIKSNKSRDKPSKMIVNTGESFIVNRDEFTRAISAEIDLYVGELLKEGKSTVRENFIKKMNEICRIHPIVQSPN